MHTLSDAATYDEWANANEAAAEQILKRLDSVPEEIRGSKRLLADWLMAEAVELRSRAEELREHVVVPFHELTTLPGAAGLK